MILQNQIMDVKKQEDDEASLGTSVASSNDNGDCGLWSVQCATKEFMTIY